MVGELIPTLEALLFVAERPLTVAELAEFLGVPRREAEQALADLDQQLTSTGRGLRLQHAADAWQMVTAPEVGERLAAYAASQEARLTPASLEALAVVAYQQPCTRAEVERARGVDSDYVLRSLLHRRLIVEVGRRDAPGRPILYGTTFAFLERFGLGSLDELPALPADAGPTDATSAEAPTTEVTTAAVGPGADPSATTPDAVAIAAEDAGRGLDAG